MYKVLSNLKHNSNEYKEGDILEDIEKLQAEELVTSGVLKKMKEKTVKSNTDKTEKVEINKRKTKLSKMSSRQLRKISKKYEIDVKDLSDKDLINAILRAENIRG